MAARTISHRSHEYVLFVTSWDELVLAFVTRILLEKQRESVVVKQSSQKIKLKMPPVAANSSINAQAEQLRKVNEQLRREARLNRHKLGECAQE